MTIDYQITYNMQTIYERKYLMQHFVDISLMVNITLRFLLTERHESKEKFTKI
jgi:hypothetical protein